MLRHTLLVSSILAAAALFAPSGASAMNIRGVPTIGSSHSVPELDPGSASAALALLGGGVALLRGRGKPRSKS